MRRGTTPTNTFAVDVDLTGATVYVSKAEYEALKAVDMLTVT